MAHSHMSHTDFFSKLSELLNARQGKDHGRIYLTQKRLSHGTVAADPNTVEKSNLDVFPDLHPASPLPVLVRATNGKGKKTRDQKVKLSTVVQPDEIDGFFVKYADICKAGMSGLKKRDRKGRRTNKAKKKKAPADGEAKS